MGRDRVAGVKALSPCPQRPVSVGFFVSFVFFVVKNKVVSQLGRFLRASMNCPSGVSPPFSDGCHHEINEIHEKELSLVDRSIGTIHATVLISEEVVYMASQLPQRGTKW
jgi:hypothetical protein